MSDVYTVTCPRNDNVFIHLMAGHFISSNNHINYYIGTSDVARATPEIARAT